MSELLLALKKRFGEQRVTDFTTYEEGYIDLIQIDIQTKHSLKVILTNGMSSYKMPVPQHLKNVKDRVYNELFFCLPEYWDINEKENPNRNWPINILQRLAKNVIENETWYGPGHTIANGNPTKRISDKMKQEYFLLADPIDLEDFFQPLQVGEKEIHFLAIIPLFNKEYDQLVYKAYPKWIRKFRSKDGNEILDEFKTENSRRGLFFRR